MSDGESDARLAWRDRVAWISIRRPAARNAFDLDLLDRLGATGEGSRRQGAPRRVISGTEGAPSAGAEATGYLPGVVGLARAAELLFGAAVVDVAPALALGLANRVVPRDPLERETWTWALDLAERPAGSLAEVKSILEGAWQRGLAGQIEAEDEAMLRLAGSADCREGVNAVPEKRAPGFA